MMRIAHLDGLRGIAILLVFFYHAYSRWSSHVPYGDSYADIPVFELGWLGVQLFFLISGFVIFMSLDKAETLTSFFYKRWLRLFPAMLIASVFIYFTAPLFSERPSGEPDLLGILPGLTFIEPGWWEKFFDIEIVPLEGVFWSLYVEFKFYILAGLIYFGLGRHLLVPVLVALYLAAQLFYVLSLVSESGWLDVANDICSVFSLKYFGWFAAGAMFYLSFQEKSEKWFLLAIVAASVCSIAVRYSFYVGDIIAALMISALFAVNMKVKFMQNILQNRILLFFGFISYPLYLIHENILVAIIIKFARYTPWLHSFLYPLVAVAMLSGIAYFIAYRCEPTVRHLLSRFIASGIGQINTNAANR